MASDSKKNLSMVSLTIPIFMEQMLKIFVSSIDTFMLSGFSADAVAAVGMMGQYYFFICIMFKVTYVSNVPDVAHFITKVRQVAEHQVESDGRTCMTQMGIAINGRTANVHAHMGGVQRFERLLATRQRVVNV